MTTFVDFLPTATKPFQFNPTLDGASYSLVVTWGLAGQRWYFNLYDQTGALVVYLPLIGSPSGVDIESMTWDQTTRLVTVTTALPHRLWLGVPVTLTISDMLPVAFNGVFDLLPIGPQTLTYSQPDDPGGPSTTQGIIGRDIDLVAGYFKTSTLVFREHTKQFEVAP